MKRFIALTTLIMPLLSGGQTLTECQQAAERNYPLIRQYDLISKTTDLTVANIQKGWLPQVSAQAQVTWQTDVTSFPESMQNLYQQAGINMRVLRKDQYRVGIDVRQTIFDGGAISNRKEITRRQGAVEEAQTDVAMYQVRQRINEMYFGLLLLNEQIRLNGNLQKLLSSNERKLLAMFERGTAAESDYLSVKAERLNVAQQAITLDAQRQAVMKMLSAFCGIEVKTVEKPAVPVTETQPTRQRPELEAINARLRLADAQEKALNAAIMPQLSVFAQGFYGYPGYNMFEDMMHRQWPLNGMVGARLTWNIGALYTHKNDKAKIQQQRNINETNRSVFVFNNNIEQIRQRENIECFRRLTTDDAEIISLRTKVRQAAESKLAHGIADVNDLLKEINAENNAWVDQAIHEIKMLKEMYDLKFTTNN